MYIYILNISIFLDILFVCVVKFYKFLQLLLLFAVETFASGSES